MGKKHSTATVSFQSQSIQSIPTKRKDITLLQCLCISSTRLLSTKSKVECSNLSQEFTCWKNIRHINFYFIFCWLHTYNKQFENLKSLKIFKSALVCQTYVFFPPKSPIIFKLKQACLEWDKTCKLSFQGNFQISIPSQRKTKMVK